MKRDTHIDVAGSFLPVDQLSFLFCFLKYYFAQSVDKEWEAHGGSDSKESACSGEDPGSVPGLG